MGKFDDYISSLDGKENIDPLVIASTLLELHNEEIGIAQSKIASLETDNETHISSIAERDAEITRQKAKNWDLANRIPATNENDQDNDNNPDVPEKAGFDKFFKDEI